MSDSYIHVEDSIKNELLKLEVDGVCEQKTTVGRNTLKPTIINTTVLNGVTYIPTYNSNGILEYIRVTGTASPISSELPIGNFDVKNGTSYVISGTSDISEAKGLFYQLYEKDTKNWKTNIQSNNRIYTATEDASYDLVIHVGKEKTVDAIFYPQVVEGTQIYPYEPYTGGQPSPSPDYPQEIKTITDSLKVTSCGKNIYNIFNWRNNPPEIAGNGSISVDKDVVTIKTISSSDIYTISGTNITGVTITQGLAYIIPAKPNTRYTLTYKLNISTEKPKQSSYISELTASHTILSLKNISVNSRTIGSGTFQYYLNISTNEKTNFIGLRLGVNKDVDGSVYKWYDIMLLEGTYNFDDIPSYEEYIESQIQANLPEDEFIGKLNDTYKDTLRAEYFPEEGQYHLMLDKMVGKITFSSSDDWHIANNTNNTVRFSLTNAQYNPYWEYETDKPNFKSTHLLPETFANVYSYGRLGISSYFNADKTIVNWIICLGNNSTLATFKTWLSNNQVEAYYPLKTPYTLDLGVIDMPLSYNEVTNIFTDSDLLPRINAKYYKNFITTIRNLQVNNDTLKNELVSIKNRLTTLENANTSVVSESEVADDIQEQ